LTDFNAAGCGISGSSAYNSAAMIRSLLKALPWLLILALFSAGIDAALSESLHADHGDSSVVSNGNDTTEPEDHDDGHCCHAAGHLLGAVGASSTSLITQPWIALPTGVSMLLEPGQAPPTPPPTH